MVGRRPGEGWTRTGCLQRPMLEWTGCTAIMTTTCMATMMTTTDIASFRRSKTWLGTGFGFGVFFHDVTIPGGFEFCLRNVV